MRPYVIDLRSDTVTQPTQAMRRVVLEAPLGDDGYGEDPTARALEARAAALMGKEAGVLVSSGTQGNLVALLAQAPRGAEVIVGEASHIYCNEVGGLAAIGGLLPRVVPDEGGAPQPDAVRRALRPKDDIHAAPTALVCLENTHGDRGGVPVPAARVAAIAEVAHAYGALVHVDGARIFNASVALGVAPANLVAAADTVTFCLSKGLAAPVGSVVCGSAAFATRAREVRKLLGGGMRQAGWIAAAGLVALDQMVQRLFEDHEVARVLARGLAEVPGLRSSEPATNIVFVDISGTGLSAEAFMLRLAAVGVLTLAQDESRLRLVTHHGISREDAERAALACAEVVLEARAGVPA